MIRRSFCCCLVLVLSGCASAQWVKPNTSEADLHRDAFECDHEAQRLSPPPTNPFAAARTRDLFNKCMRSKGWTEAR